MKVTLSLSHPLGSFPRFLVLYILIANTGARIQKPQSEQFTIGHLHRISLHFLVKAFCGETLTIFCETSCVGGISSQKLDEVQVNRLFKA
jgi:hypothetical protein